VTPLHYIGDFLRELLLAVPLPAARALFLAVPIALLIWVLLLPRQDVTASAGEARGGWSTNLKVWAALALLVQILIYSVL